jgi:DNA-binding transcriptional LysR family regulator
MKRLDLSTLQLMVLIADSGSLTEAAKRASLTLAAVSKRLLEFESQLQLALFTRLPKGVVPTEAGRTVVAHARQALFDFDRLEAELSEFRVGRSGTVRLGANASAMTQFLPEDLGRFSRQHPAVRVDLTELTSDAIVARVADARLDLGIFSATVAYGGVQTFGYRSDRVCVVTRKGSRLARRRCVAFDEIRDQPFIGLEPGSSIVQLLHSRAGSALKMPVQARSFDVACRFVQAGLGLALIPERSAELYAPTMGLAIVALDDEWARRDLLIGTRSYDTLSASARLLLEELRAEHR